MGSYGSRQFRVVRLVSGVRKQHIENRHCALLFSQLIEQARVSPALPQPGRFIQCQPRGVIHFDDDHIVGNSLRNEDEREVKAQAAQGLANLKPRQTKATDNCERSADYPPTNIVGQFGLEIHWVPRNSDNSLRLPIRL